MSEKEICQKVRDAVQQKGIKVVWLAEKTGIEYNRLQRCVRGELPFRAAEYERLKAVLGIE